MDFHALEAQPKFGGSGKPPGSLRAGDYELGVRALGDDNLSVLGDVMRDGGDNAFADFSVFRADGLVNRYGDGRAGWNRCCGVSQSRDAEAKR